MKQSTCGNDTLRHTLIMLDLLIRSGAERRLSDMLRHDAGYADLLFGTVAWPKRDADVFHATLAQLRPRAAAEVAT